MNKIIKIQAGYRVHDISLALYMKIIKSTLVITAKYAGSKRFRILAQN